MGSPIASAACEVEKDLKTLLIIVASPTAAALQVMLAVTASTSQATSAGASGELTKATH